MVDQQPVTAGSAQTDRTYYAVLPRAKGPRSPSSRIQDDGRIQDAPYGQEAPPSPAERQLWTDVHRQALTLLRPSLNVLWLDVRPTTDGWPPEVLRQVGELRERPRVAASAAQPGATGAQRRGTGTDTVLLYPSDQADFRLALSLAPFSTAVEGMSARGQLLYARRHGEDELRICLTDDEYVRLTSSVPEAEVTRLTRDDVDAGWIPRRQPSRFRPLTGCLVGVVAIVSGVPGLLHGPTGDWIGSLFRTVVGVLLLGRGLWALIGLIRSDRNSRSRADRPQSWR